jgi:hypothetical protein
VTGTVPAAEALVTASEVDVFDFRVFVVGWVVVLWTSFAVACQQCSLMS